MHLKNSNVGFLLKVFFLYGKQVIFEGLLRGINRRIHLKVIGSFTKNFPKFLLKRLYIRSVVKRASDSTVLLRLTKAKARVDASAVKRVCLYNAYLPTMGGGENLTAHTIAYLNQIFPSASIDILCHETRAFDKSRFTGKDFVRMLEKEFDLTLRNTNVRFVDFDFNIHTFMGNLRYTLQLSSLSKEYDLFINNTFISLVLAQAKVNIYYCMFPFDLSYSDISLLGPFRRRFYNRFLRSYDLFLSISRYTQKWVDQYWNVNSFVLYPPVKSINKAEISHKENIIINVGRFFAGGHNKKQDVMAKTFIEMYKKGWARNWKLVMVGRQHSDENSMSYIQALEESIQGYPIEIRYDASAGELEDLLQRAKIYWHATGYDEAVDLNPEKFEHFGLSTIEAAQLGAVPVVFNGGGQPEIIHHTKNGFLWDTTEELMNYTKLLIEDENIWSDCSNAGFESMKIFDTEKQLGWFTFFLSPYYNFEQQYDP